VTLTTIQSIPELRTHLEQRRVLGERVGLVPTMGFLHRGHTSLIKAAAAENEIVVTSLFVNPLQFAESEDLTDYPRNLERDMELAEAAGSDLLFTPSVDEMYPFGPVLTSVSVTEISERWEGETRPTHFAGVATVVAKLFSIMGPCRAYFGEKDFQQLTIIRRMAADLSMPVDVVGCPIVREPDGLAMSSRNVYLNSAERAAACVLRRALDAGLEAIEGGQRSAVAISTIMSDLVDAEPLADLDYCAVVDAQTLEQHAILSGDIRLLVAAKIGRPRLIDNAGARI